jgi:hypothetical protein
VKRQPIPQAEFGFADASFALVKETTEDGERVTREREQSTRDRAESEARQTTLTPKETELRKVCPGYREGAPIASEFGRPEAVETVSGGLTFDGEVSHECSETTQPGLADGSQWHKWTPKGAMDQAMRKAITTL